MSIKHPVSLSIIMLLALLLMPGCQKAYLGALESVGIPKRDVLVSRVEDAQESQQEAKEQFSSALEAFRATIAVEGGELEETYDRLNREYKRSENDAEAVSERIEEVEGVAEALFDEWEDELDEITNSTLRADSRRKLSATRDRYGDLMSAMRRAESKMEPVLIQFRDQVLFLKHNLNARAIASLDGELASIELDVDRLIRDMERSIDEAADFISSMRAD